MADARDPADEEAADWFARLQSRSVSTDELEAFAAWRRDPANAAAYRRVQALWDLSDQLSNDDDIRDALNAGSERRTIWSRQQVTRPVLLLATVAAAVVLVLGIMSFDTNSPTRSYQTAVGERSSASLADGTQLQLDTDSQVATRFADDRRQVTLERGQAFFRVAHDAGRPFVVDAGDGITVTAVGTAFDVQRSAERVRVALVEGAVLVRRGEVELTRMAPGGVVEVAVGNGLVATRRTVAEATSWRAGHLSFRETPLAQAVDEMNRYTEAKLRITATQARGEPISGEFSVDDPQGFARAVDALLGPGTVAR